MSSGSLAEVETHMTLAERFADGAVNDVGSLLSSLHAVARQLQSLKKALTRKLAENVPFRIPRSPFPKR